MGMYVFYVNWYDDWDGKDRIARGVVCATNYSDAVMKINNRFHCINSVTIDEMEDADFLWLSEENYDILRKDNDGLNPDDEEDNTNGTF